MVWLVLFIGTIFGANWAIETFGFVPVGFGLEAPAGVYFAGLAFTFRDLIHRTIGKWWTLAGIAIGAALSYLISPAFAAASAVAFTFSELADFAVYTPLWKRRWLVAVAASNAVGLTIDSVLFLWLAFGALTGLAGLIVGKVWVTAVSVIVLWWWRRARTR